MALMTTISTPFGVVVENAYVRIENAALVGKYQFSFQIRCYVDKEKPAFHQQAFDMVYDPGAGDIYGQMYGLLKTLPDFIGSIDC